MNGAYYGPAEVGFQGPAGSTLSDGAFGLARYEGSAVTGYNAQDATFLTTDGELNFNATETVDISIEVASTRLKGYIRGPVSGYELSVPLVGSVESADLACASSRLG